MLIQGRVSVAQDQPVEAGPSRPEDGTALTAGLSTRVTRGDAWAAGSHYVEEE